MQQRVKDERWLTRELEKRAKATRTGQAERTAREAERANQKTSRGGRGGAGFGGIGDKIFAGVTLFLMRLGDWQRYCRLGFAAPPMVSQPPIAG